MGRALRAFGIVTGIAIWAGVPLEARPSENTSPLELKVSDYEVRAVSIVDALRHLGTRVSGSNLILTLQAAPFEQEPEKNLTLALRHGTVREVLNGLVAQDPRYTFQVIGSELVHVFPVGANKDPQDLLNTKVKLFSVSGISYDLVLKYPYYYIPELSAEVARRSKSSEAVGHTMGNVGVPTITITLRDVTVRDILNEIARRAAMASKSKQIHTGWIYTFRVDKFSPLGGYPRWELL